jgi:hypothetical protein
VAEKKKNSTKEIQKPTRKEPDSVVAKLEGFAQKTLVQAGLIPVSAGSPSTQGALLARSVPDFRGLSKRKVLAILDERKLACRVVGSGVAESQSPAPGSALGKGETCKIVFRAD